MADEWDRNAVATRNTDIFFTRCFFFSVQYKNRKHIINIVRIELAHTCSAICFKTIQAVSFSKLGANGTSRSFIFGVSSLYITLFIYISKWKSSKQNDQRCDEGERKKKKGKMKYKNQFGTSPCYTNTNTQTRNNFNGTVCMCWGRQIQQSKSLYDGVFLVPPLHMHIYAHARTQPNSAINRKLLWLRQEAIIVYVASTNVRLAKRNR